MNPSDQNSNSKELTIKYNNVDFNRLTFTELKEGKYSKGQKNSYPKYNHPILGPNSPMFIQFPWLTVFTYGIPKIGEYIKTDDKRLFIKCPLDLQSSECNDFYNMFIKNLDEFMVSDNMKESLFGKKNSKYEYQQTFKVPKQKDDDDDDGDNKYKKKIKYPNPPYLKLNFDVTYPENNIKTVVYKSQGNSKREKLNGINTINDLEKIICWKCKIKPIVKLSKVWAQTVGTGKYGPEYGITFTIIKIEVEPPSDINMSDLYNRYLEHDTFIDDDDDNKVVESKSTDSKSINTKDNDASVRTAQIISDSDDSDESDTDVIESKQNKSDSDNDSDEEIKSVQPKKNIINEEIKSIKPKSKTKPKPIQIDEESEDEIKTPDKSIKNKSKK